MVGLATYCASKHAVVGFTDSARLEYRSAGVKFSMVLPTFVNTELTAGTHGAKGFKNAEPGRISPTRSSGWSSTPSRGCGSPRRPGRWSCRSGSWPRAMAEGLNRTLGGEHVFTDDVDVEKRKAYEARARGEE